MIINNTGNINITCSSFISLIELGLRNFINKSNIYIINRIILKLYNLINEIVIEIIIYYINNNKHLIIKNNKFKTYIINSKINNIKVFLLASIVLRTKRNIWIEVINTNSLKEYNNTTFIKINK